MQKPENIFPKFKTGDPAGKVLNAEFLNGLTGSIANLSQPTIGAAGISNGIGQFTPDGRPPTEVKLVKVIDIGTPATGNFVGPVGKVNVIQTEVVDALFEEAVGPQTLTELGASGHIIYAGEAPGSSTAVNDFVWIVRWSHQWWVMNGGGGGAAIVMFEITDTSESGSGCVDAVVDAVAYGLSDPEVGDMVTVEDITGCFFNVDPAFLLGVKGFAIKMDGPGSCEPYSADDFHWAVTSLCCTLGGCP